MRHSFVILFFFFYSNFRSDDGEEDAPLYNGYLFQRSREQESYQNQPGAYPPYPYYLTSKPRIPYQYVPQEAPRSCSPISSSQADLSGEKGVKETRVMQVRPQDSAKNSKSRDNDKLATVTTADPTTVAVGEKPNEKEDSPCPPKKKKKRASLDGKEAESTILNLMEAQQAAIEKADEKDQRMFEALLKSQSDSQQRHQEFTLSVLGKLGEIFSSKKIKNFFLYGIHN